MTGVTRIAFTLMKGLAVINYSRFYLFFKIWCIYKNISKLYPYWYGFGYTGDRFMSVMFTLKNIYIQKTFTIILMKMRV